MLAMLRDVFVLQHPVVKVIIVDEKVNVEMCNDDYRIINLFTDDEAMDMAVQMLEQVAILRKGRK